MMRIVRVFTVQLRSLRGGAVLFIACKTFGTCKVKFFLIMLWLSV